MTFRSRGKHPASFRSGFEEKIAEQLTKAGIKVEYESKESAIIYTQDRGYTPDFVLPNGIIIETKGYFDSEDRRKHRDIQEQHPDKDIRFVFGNSKNKLNKSAKMTYAGWCEKHGFLYADKRIPEEWLNE